jgi:hypothetical protein
MDACTSISAFQLVGLALTFLLAVLSLDMFWAGIPHGGDITETLRKRNWLNIFVAAGAAGAVISLLHWTSGCSNGAF